MKWNRLTEKFPEHDKPIACVWLFKDQDIKHMSIVKVMGNDRRFYFVNYDGSISIDLFHKEIIAWTYVDEIIDNARDSYINSGQWR